MSLAKKFIPIKPPRIEPGAPAIQDALRSIAGDLKKDFERTTETWSQRPAFSEPIVVRMGNAVSCRVTTDDPRWIWINAGTGARIIRPRRKKALAFQVGYKAKTRPGQLASFPGGRFGPRIVRAAVYGYKGIRPRRFVEAARKKYQEKLPDAIRLRVAVSLAKRIP